MSGEDEVLTSVMARVEQLCISAGEALELSEPLPRDLQAFDAMDKQRRVATKAVLKVVEELEEQLMRLFRTILNRLAVDINGLYARDIADHMERLGIVDDAVAWTGIVKLRNRLVHDYLLSVESRFAKLTEGVDAIDDMKRAAGRASIFIVQRGWA